jgi:hypothetical protein
VVMGCVISDSEIRIRDVESINLHPALGPP